MRILCVSNEIRPKSIRNRHIRRETLLLNRILPVVLHVEANSSTNDNDVCRNDTIAAN
jgi:hypothetical protein